MNFDTMKALDHQYVMQNYSRFDVAIDHGEGATLYDPDGQAYVDFTSGIGVSSLGYNHPAWAKAIEEQIHRVAHVSNLFYSEPYVRLAEQLCTRTGLAAALFSSGGAEANECLIKLARKYSFDKYGRGRATIITLRNSFHGRTITTLTATGQDKFHDYFFPFTEGFRYAEPNLAAVQEQDGDDVCAVLVELIQGEGGVLPLEQAFVSSLAAWCREKDYLLLVDEVQTGIGRTGSLFCFQQYGILPDVCSFAKGIAGGLPLSGVLCAEKCRNVLTPGTHGTTFGGNPVAASAALVVLDTLDGDMLAEIRAKGQYIRDTVRSWNLPCVEDVRGMGLMLGIVLKDGDTRADAVKEIYANHVLVLTAGPKTIRLLPPLVITKEEIDAGLAVIQAALSHIPG